MDLTVVIPVGRHPEHLVGLLSDLAYQSFAGRILLAWHRSEVEESLVAILDGLNGRGPRIELVHGIGGSAPELRNTALGLIDTEWVLFLDDDIVLSDGYLDELQILLGDPRGATIIQGSAIQALNRNNWLARCEERLSDARLRRWRHDDLLQVCDARNLLMVTKVAKEFPFDHRLRLGSEGHELAMRLTGRGYNIYFAERLLVFHQHRTTLSALAHQKFWHGRGRVQLSIYNSQPIGFTQHLFGPFRYWHQGRIPLNLVPYAVLSATMFCSGMIVEAIAGRHQKSWSSER